jgi:hypothetical protein
MEEDWVRRLTKEATDEGRRVLPEVAGIWVRMEALTAARAFLRRLDLPW